MKDSLSMIMVEILTHEEAKVRIPADLAVRYQQLCATLGSARDQAYALYLRADLLGDEGRYCEALVVFEDALRRFPSDIRLQQMHASFVMRIAGSVQQLGDSSPESAEFGRSYEMLQEVGQASIRMHLAAVHHYRLSGKTERALTLITRLEAVAPGFPGVQESMALLEDSTERTGGES